MRLYNIMPTIGRRRYMQVSHMTRLYTRTFFIAYKPARTLRSSSSDLLVVPHRVKTITASRAFRVAALTIWNSLPNVVRVSDSFNVVKRRLKYHLFDAAFQTTVFPIDVSVSQPHKQCIISLLQAVLINPSGSATWVLLLLHLSLSAASSGLHHAAPYQTISSFDISDSDDHTLQLS